MARLVALMGVADPCGVSEEKDPPTKTSAPSWLTPTDWNTPEAEEGVASSVHESVSSL